MIRWIIRRWHARQRAIDIEMLWPSCRRLAGDLDRARAAFALHAFHDAAWLELGPDGIAAVIEGLS